MSTGYRTCDAGGYRHRSGFLNHDHFGRTLATSVTLTWKSLPDRKGHRISSQPGRETLAVTRRRTADPTVKGRDTMGG